MAKNNRVRLYDCFSLWNEKELLDLRIHHLYDVVDKFVIVEGDHTFAGEPIPCFFDTVRKEYEWASDKIIHIRVSLDPKPKSRWDNEAKQRDGFELGLDGASPEDLILIGCVDEIPRVELLEEFKKSKDNVLTMLELDNFYYYFNGKDVGASAKYPCPVLTRKKNINHGVHKLWSKRYDFPITKDAGWHFSYMGGAEAIKKKLESASHSELDTDYHKDIKRLEHAIAEGNDIFDRGDHQFQYVRIDDTFPEYLVKNKKKYRHLIL